MTRTTEYHLVFAQGSRPFEHCFRVVSSQGGACATCVWNSHARRCPSDGDDEEDDGYEGSQ